MNNKGQNVIEYILLVVAVVLVCLAFFNNGAMKQSVNASLNVTIHQLQNITNEIRF